MISYTLHEEEGFAGLSVLLASLPAGEEVTLHLTKGLYRFPASIELPTELSSLVIEGEEGTELTGRISFDAVWEPYRDGIYRAPVEWEKAPDALFFGGRRMVLCRYPDYTEGKLFGGFAADALDPVRTAGWKDPKGGHVLALHFAEWGSNDYVIEGKDEQGELLLRWVGDNNRGSGMHPTKRMVENVWEELDAPAEWYYSEKERMLYFFPPDGLSPDSAETEAVFTERFFRIRGKSCEAPAVCYVFRGLSFTDSARTLFTGHYERPLRGDWGIVRDGALLFENCRDIRVENCSFVHIGGNALTFSGYHEEHTVANCRFTHIGATGVLIAGLTSAVRDPSFFDNEEHHTVIADFGVGPKSEDYPRSITVTGCLFRDIGVFEKQTAAVCMSVSRRITVSGCTVCHCSRAGINIHDGTFGGHLLENNDLFDCVTETADHGPINCWGRDRYWSLGGYTSMGFNGREKRPFARLDAVETTLIRHNRIRANYAFGIDIDDGASGYDIHDNLCIGVGIKLRDGFDRRVFNNILIGAGFDIHMSFACNNDLVFGNIVVNDRAYNRICVNEGTTAYFGGNLFWNYGEPVKGITGEEYAPEIADPCFADPEANDFTLLPSSPAFRKGFLPFPAGDSAFGVADAPKPEKYRRLQVRDTCERVRFYDLVLSDIDGDGMRSAAGLPDLDGAFVLERDVLGLFCKMGIAVGVGDIIRSVNGRKIKKAADFVKYFNETPAGVFAGIEIYRNQRPLSLSFLKPGGEYVSIVDGAVGTWEKLKQMDDPTGI